jgi:chorismate synthase
MFLVLVAVHLAQRFGRRSLRVGHVDAREEETKSFKERTDVTAVPAMGVVAETMVALVLADEAQRKFGGDSVEEFVRNARSFAASLK